MESARLETEHRKEDRKGKQIALYNNQKRHGKHAELREKGIVAEQPDSVEMIP